MLYINIMNGSRSLITKIENQRHVKPEDYLQGGVVWSCVPVCLCS